MMLRSNMFCRFGFLLALGGPMFCPAGESPERQIREMNQFREYVLAQGEVYKIYVKKDDGVTTVTFPSAISKIAGVNVSTDGSADFQISAQPGGYYFNLAALKEGAAGTLTVVFNRKTYILYLVQDNAKAFAAVNFTGGSGGGPEAVGRSGGVTPARLLSLIDMAKAYDLLMQRYPTELRDTKRSTARAVFQFEKFRLELLEVIRFHHEDTLVFKVLLHNDTDEEILYDKFSFSVQAGNRTYPMSAADATGVMPPQSATYAFFTVTGTPEGRRNNLAPDNDFKVGVTAQYMETAPLTVVPEQPDRAEAKMDRHLEKLTDSVEKLLVQQAVPAPAAEPAEEENAGKLPETPEKIEWWDFSEFPSNLAFLINWM